jgi:hypothetical protein
METTSRDRSKAIWWTVAMVSLVLSGALPTTVLAERVDEWQRYHSPHWELDMRHDHDHFYPARGYIVATLPPNSVHILFGGNHFYFRAGVWFRATGPNFVVVTPPPGVAVPALPPSYSTILIGGIPYYYANGVYYAPMQGAPGYVVAAPPPGYETVPPPPVPSQPAPVVAPPPGVAAPPPGYETAPPPAPSAAVPEAVFVYPRNGQTEAQITADRSECNRWATSQTGYDPAGANVADAQAQQRAHDFKRAMSACLDGRGYTVN